MTLQSFKKYDITGISDTKKAASICYPFQLLKADLQTVLPIKLDSDGNETNMPVSIKSVIRSDGVELGSVGANFNLLEADEAASHFQPYIDSKLVKLHSGGECDQGRKFWMQGSLVGAEADVIKGDSIKGNLLMAVGFVGNLPYVTKQTNTRVVCQNTLARAQVDAGHGYRVKHTTNMRDRIEQVNLEMRKLIQAFHQSVEAYKTLAKKKVTKQEFQVYVRHILEAPATQKETSTKQQNIIEHITDLFEQSPQLERVPASQGTMWAGYNAVTRYLTHEYGRNDDNRLNAGWFGESAKTSERALSLAMRQ